MRIKEDVLVKPLVTEKSNELSDKLGCYSFVVDKRANKLEIKDAVEAMYSVTVEKVRTLILPAKERVRYTTKGFSSGRKPAIKKAIVTLVEGDEIDFYSNI